MRLFTGIDLPEEVQQRLEQLLEHLRPAAHLRWSPVYNLHITTKFIGEWPEEKLEQLQAALARAPKREPISIHINGLGWFPNPHSPRVFWAAVHAGPGLAELAKTLEDALEPLGIARETRPFSPHLTLARITQAVPLQALREAVAGLESADFGVFPADRFHLYLSKPGAAGTVYTKLAQYPFAE